MLLAGIYIPAQNYLKIHIIAQLFQQSPMLTRIFYFLVLLLTFSACCREKDLHLAPSLSAWLPYTEGQQISFAGPDGKKLVFEAFLSHFNQEGNDKACGAYAIETRQVQLKSLHDPAFLVQVRLSHEVLVGLQVLRSEPAGRSLDILFNTVSGHLVSDPWRDKYLEQVQLNGQDYQQVLQVYGMPGAGDLSFAEAYYGRDKGLIGFRLFNGEQYFLE